MLDYFISIYRPTYLPTYNKYVKQCSKRVNCFQLVVVGSTTKDKTGSVPIKQCARFICN